MFWKLRLKLALLNSAVAGLILVAICAMAYFFMSYTMARQSEQTLTNIARNLEDAADAGGVPPADIVQNAWGNESYLVLSLQEDSPILVSTSYRWRLSEGQTTELINRALQGETQFIKSLGNLSGEQNRRTFISRRARSNVLRISGGQAFRYVMIGARPGVTSVYMIFLDIQQEQKLLRGVQLALGLSVLGGLVLTLLGGLFLAGRALRPVRAAWRRQRNFVADASHELRSPLAAIRCNLDVVLDDPDAPVKATQLYWEGISEETARMSVLVDELLLLARADSDAAVLQKEKIELAALAENAVSFMRPMAEKKGIELRLAECAPASVTGDPARLKQVLIALVDNAVKYTPEGGSVAVSVRRAKDKAMVEVSDTGIGIAKEHLGKIFERFYRVDKARERETGGYGLGLSIAQWVVERHGGSLTVSSEEGKGSTFTVTLPGAKE
jgi:two-component system sensor histidine kinase CiaH